MPVFFFISGFVIYKANAQWNLKYASSFLLKKVPMLLVGTTVFLILYTHYIDANLWNFVIGQFKGGYWFTYTLFLFYVFYALLSLIFRRAQDIVFLIVALLFFMAGGPKGFMGLPISDDMKGFLCLQQWSYFFYFLLGVLAQRNYNLLQKGLDGRWMIPVCIIFFVILNLYPEIRPQSGLPFRLCFLVQITAGTLLLFAFFRGRETWFTKQTVVGRSLQYIGKRTLDVYFIHYFLIPFNLSNVSTLLGDYPMPIVELIISLFLALAIVGVSLLIGNILRLSPTLAYWLFGAKSKK